MNIIEAVKSGKRFRRKTHPNYWFDRPPTDHSFTIDWILADDWEIEEKKVEITQEQLRLAVIAVHLNTGLCGGNPERAARLVGQSLGLDK